jgi:hypothetical protein
MPEVQTGCVPKFPQRTDRVAVVVFEQAQRAGEPAASVTRVVDLDLGRWCALAEANGRAILTEGFTMVSTITRSESLRLSIARL